MRHEGKPSWNEAEDFLERVAFFSATLKKHFSDNPAKVMILGCGDGETTIALGKLGHEVIGIDISPTAIQWATEKARNAKSPVTFRQANIAEAPNLDSSADAIIDDHCLHCIVGEDRKRALQNVFSHLKTGGIFVARTHCGDPPASAGEEFLKMWDEKSRCQIHNGVAGRYFGKPGDILGEIEAAGFFLEENRTFTYPNGWEMLEVVAKKK